MRIRLGTVRQSPFVGIFALATEKAVFVPMGISGKERKMLEQVFETEVIQASVANSSLLGVLAVANEKGIILPEIAEQREQAELEKQGFRVKKVENIAALGNIIEVNSGRGICAEFLPEKQRREIERFLSIELKQASIGGSDLVGANCVATNKGFLISPKATEKEFKAIKRHFGNEGTRATANYGDSFIANSVAANSSAAIVGLHTTGHELSRIDDGLTGA
ncbi:MAG: translation initiation factor IF-6 [Candidatus Diapherotrites archaeon]|uniref:Translation initiation factor IF-6 n=1 Tax=Candidatus Iainarchaeum sp. TaxID=3101447 RepID=A0A938YW26_9ARCH|nr:translation initiation factor IF-6 [Candidatus Diapherotrites archaeon]